MFADLRQRKTAAVDSTAMTTASGGLPFRPQQGKGRDKHEAAGYSGRDGYVGRGGDARERD